MEDSLLFHYEDFPFPLHSVLISHRGERIQESYGFPCTKNTFHRMFSITKSITALAVIALAAEGRISLQEPVINFFPDLCPEKPDPHLCAMTVQDLLDMRTCHKTTTYKINLRENWLRSFFVTPPDHRSGQIFKYDTSAAHVLAALVKRITGMGILDYLRTIYLSALDFSSEAFVLKDPFGDEIGGSGLVARPEDIMILSEFLMSLYKDTWREQYACLISDHYNDAFFIRYRSLFLSCVSFRSATVHEGKTLEECQGYGSQFWRIRNGFMMYGMGGQYAAFYPEEDLIIVTTADTQAIQGGTQIILDEMYRIDSLLRDPKASSFPCTTPEYPQEHGDPKRLQHTLERLSGTYRFLPNNNGFTACTISEEEVTLEHSDGYFRFPVSLHDPAETEDPKYHQKLYVFTSPLLDGSLYQYVQIMNDYLGSIRIMIQGNDGKITVYLRKIEETLFSQMDGFLEAERISK